MQWLQAWWHRLEVSSTARLTEALRASCRAGKPRRWDMVESHPSVAVLLYHRQRQAVVLVRQASGVLCCAALCCAMLWCAVLRCALHSTGVLPATLRLVPCILE